MKTSEQVEDIFFLLHCYSLQHKVALHCSHDPVLLMPEPTKGFIDDLQLFDRRQQELCWVRLLSMFRSIN